MHCYCLKLLYVLWPRCIGYKEYHLLVKAEWRNTFNWVRCNRKMNLPSVAVWRGSPWWEWCLRISNTYNKNTWTADKAWWGCKHGHTLRYTAKGFGRGQLKCDGTRAETRFRLSAKRKSPFKSAGASVQSTTGSRFVCISGSNVGYNMFWVSVKGTGYTLHSSVSPSLSFPCVTVCHHISTRVYKFLTFRKRIFLRTET